MTQAILIDALFAAIAGIGFGAISNPHKRVLIFSGLFAAIGHSFRYYLLHSGFDLVSATLFASFIIGFLGLVAGRMSGYPSEVFSFPALLPMIPGMIAYKAILSIIKFLRTANHDLAYGYIMDFLSNGLTAIFVLLAIVIGASMSVFIDTLSAKIRKRKLIDLRRKSKKAQENSEL